MSDPAIEAISFDLDALIDLDGAVAAFLYAIALRSGHDAPPAGATLLAEFAAIRDHQCLLPYRPFKQVMSDSLRVWCEQLGYAWIDGYADAMTMTTRAAPPFPDATPALHQAAAAGLTLVLVADSDHDVVCHSLNHLQTGFEVVVVAQDARTCRPAPQLFRSALDHLQTEPERVLHISPHLQRDLAPARSVGLRTAWLDRAATSTDDDHPPADFVWPTLGNVATLTAATGD